MKRSDIMRRLFASYAAADDAGFRLAARELIAAERRNNHRVLAGDLERALGDERRAGVAQPLTMRPIPRSHDERPLLRLTKPQHDLHELILRRATREVLEEIIRENLHRSILAGHGLRPRQRLLLIGPPGTGKTATAHGIGAALGLPVAVTTLAALTSSYLGDTARNVEAVIRFAEQTPCVLLFDEFDALGQDRGQVGDHGEMRRVAATVLQLLEEASGESIIVATSNHPQLVDPALWRRFDELLRFDVMEASEIAQLIALKLRSAPAAISPSTWAHQLQDFTPAEIEMACFAALRRRVLDGRTQVDDEIMTAAVSQMRTRRNGVTVATPGNGQNPDRG